jgi:hypothetical protein
MSKYYSKNQAINIAKINIETPTPNSYLLIDNFVQWKASDELSHLFRSNFICYIWIKGRREVINIEDPPSQ